jgi:hypothetical protein
MGKARTRVSTKTAKIDDALSLEVFHKSYSNLDWKSL